MVRKFFYDTEFIEHPCTIDLISIGVVDQNGNEFYEVSNEWNSILANDWVKENVIRQLPVRETWVSRNLLKHRLLEFLKPSKNDPIELWGYYSAYDHVALCWLFGPMIDLPDGMPMYTNDIKQLCDSLGNPELPKQSGVEHDALEDARWNFEAYQFLQGMKQEARDE